MALPWRGPGAGRPELPLPPDKLPIRRDGHWRKHWRYVGAFGDELLLCAARINVGPLGQTFWAIWDRTERRLWERTATLMPREPAATSGPRAGRATASSSTAPTRGRSSGSKPSTRRRERSGPSCASAPRSGSRRSARPPTASTSGRESAWTCPSNATSGSASVAPDRGPGRRGRVRGLPPAPHGLGLVGRCRQGNRRAIGRLEPRQRHQRSAGALRAGIWVDGEPTEPGPVGSTDSRRSASTTAPALTSPAEAERQQGGETLRRPLHVPTALRRLQRHASGRARAGEGLGVMEHHDAHW